MEAWEVDLAVAEAAVRSATSVARSATLRVIAPRVEGTEAVATAVEEAMEAVTVLDVAVAEAEADRPATLAEDMDTCLATAPRARNATIVRMFELAPCRTRR